MKYWKYFYDSEAERLNCYAGKPESAKKLLTNRYGYPIVTIIYILKERDRYL